MPARYLAEFLNIRTSKGASFRTVALRYLPSNSSDSYNGLHAAAHNFNNRLTGCLARVLLHKGSNDTRDSSSSRYASGS